MDREVVIVPYRDGPYLVRGPVSMRDQRGNLITLARDPIALCRCGKSQTRPFCDGTHRSIRFQAPSELEREPTSGFQDAIDEARIPGSSARTVDPPRRAGERRRKLATASPVAHAALTRAARAAAMMTDTAGRRATSLIAGALRLLAGGDAASSLLLIDGALDALTSAATQADVHSARAVTELRAATSALSATS